jgi:hypothetical protein
VISYDIIPYFQHRHIQDIVGIDVEAHVDLGHVVGHRRDAEQLKLA